MYKKLRIVLCLALILCLSACTGNTPATNPTPTPDDSKVDLQSASKDNRLHVHVIDVGQGDSIFIELPDGSTMLIDAGEREYGPQVASYIQDLGYNSISYVIGTHPHSDHIGGLQRIIEAFSVGAVYLPDKASTTTTFTSLLQSIKSQNKKVQKAEAGKTICEGEDFIAEILSPFDRDYGDNMNLYSVVIRLSYGEKSFLFLGDAEAENEKDLKGVTADFVKVGHHASKTSSSASFVKGVAAEIAVVSVSDDNSYGLPKEEILKRWRDSGAILYRTDELGTVVAHSDGKTITMDSGVEMPTQAESESESHTNVLWIVNISSKKIHLPECSAIQTMSEKNRMESDKSIEQLIAEGYSPCGRCDPSEG